MRWTVPLVQRTSTKSTRCLVLSPEVQSRIADRQIAGAAAHLPHLDQIAGDHFHLGTHAVPIAAGALGAHHQPVVRVASLIADQFGRTAAMGCQDIDVSIPRRSRQRPCPGRPARGRTKRPN